MDALARGWIWCHHFGVPTRLLAIAVIVGFLAGCTGGSGDGPTPTPTPTRPAVTTPAPTSSSPSAPPTGPLTTGPNVRPGEKPPSIPAVAARKSQAGALQLAGYYFKALDWVIATNDDFAVRQIAAPGCRSCHLVYDAIAQLRARDEKEIGGRIRVKSASLDPKHYRGKYDFVFRVEYTEQAATLVSANGAKKILSHATSSTSLIFVIWTAAGWRVINVTSA